VLLPGVEDFGIVPVEAQACGRPAIGLAHGGTAETILDGRTGVLVAESSGQAFADGIGRLECLALEPSALRQHALAFSRERFVASFARHVDELMAASEETARW
jgi:glycosyltransferase involved in cell wall biosynthesis